MLDRLYQQGLIRPLDYHFACWLGQHCKVDDALLMLAALVSQQAGEGHVCMRLDQPTDYLRHWPEPLRQQGQTYWAQAIRQISAGVLDTGGILSDGSQVAPLVYQHDRLYLYRYWQAEVEVVRALLQRAHTVPLDGTRLLDCLDRFFTAAPVDGQRMAAVTAVSRSLAIISGGPGTGKTTTVTKMLAVYLLLQAQQHPQRTPVIRLAAPTGKAAARLSESIAQAKQQLALTPELAEAIPDQGTTLHRLLGARPGEGGYRHHGANPLHVDYLVVDEASMIDLTLMAALLDALPTSARLLLIGDRQQLASVEAGSVLGDICAQPASVARSDAMIERLNQTCQAGLVASGVSATFADSLAFLHKSYRFDEHSGIGALARAVNQGDSQRALQVLQHGYSDLALHPLAQQDSEPLLVALEHGYRDYLQAVQHSRDAATLLKLFNQFQLLCGQRQGPFGVETLNQLFEQRLNGHQHTLERGRWYAGRPIMITRNDAGLGLYNGDIGITLWDEQRQHFRVWFEQGGQLRSVATSRLPSHESVFAMTVHKSQGSEFTQVALVIADDARVYTRELLYTGLTRARQHCRLYAQPRALRAAIGRPTLRISGLAARIW